MNICVILLRTMFKRLSFIFALSLTICLFLFSSVQAAPPIKDINYAGKFVSQSVADPIEIEAGKNREVTIKIKNIGTNGIFQGDRTNNICGGGGLYLDNCNNTELESVYISDNRCLNGYAIFANNNYGLKINSSILSNNSFISANIINMLSDPNIDSSFPHTNYAGILFFKNTNDNIFLSNNSFYENSGSPMDSAICENTSAVMNNVTLANNQFYGNTNDFLYRQSGTGIVITNNESWTNINFLSWPGISLSSGNKITN